MNNIDEFKENYEYACSEIFGEKNDFIDWLFDILRSNSYILFEWKVSVDIEFDELRSSKDRFECNFSIMKNDENNIFDLMDRPYKDAYKYLNGSFHIPQRLSFKIKDVKHPNRPIYKVPLIKALYYSYKHRNRRFY